MIKKLKVFIILFLFVIALFGLSQSQVYAGYCEPDVPGVPVNEICP